MAPHPNNPKPLPYHRRTWPNGAGGMKQCHHGGSDRGGRLNLSRRQEAPVQTEHRSGCSSWSGTAGSPDDGRACSTANCALGNEHGPHTTPNTPHRTNLWITHTYTHTQSSALFPGLPGWAGTRKVKPIWILLKQETVSGSGISWAICKSAPHSRQITTPAPHNTVFYGLDALPAAQPTASKHWRPITREQFSNHGCCISSLKQFSVRNQKSVGIFTK